MRYLVISPCEDVRTGKAFKTGDEFLPEPDPKQADRLIAARCIESIPDSAPTLPGTNPLDAKIAELEQENRDLRSANGDLRGKLAKAAIDAGAETSKAKREIDQLIGERDDLKGELASAVARVTELEKASSSASEKGQPATAVKGSTKDKAGA